MRRWPPSFAALCWWLALWMGILGGTEYLKPPGIIKEAAGYGFSGAGVPACWQVALRASTRGASVGCVRVWRQTRGVLPFLPSEAVLGLPDDEGEAGRGGAGHGRARQGKDFHTTHRGSE